MVSVLLLVLTVCSYTSVVLGAWEDGNTGIDRPGGDLPGMPITLNTSQPQDCAKLCQNTNNCKAWAYSQTYCSSRNFTQPPWCYLKGTIMGQHPDPCMVSGIVNAYLIPPKFVPLPLGSIKPQGWLKQQLRIQADGLSGHLPLFWPDVENSSWIGGNADTGLHERAPYWLNGFVPLAYQLNDTELVSMAEKYIWFILGNQSILGWLGKDDINDGNKYWSKYHVLFVLRMYFEVTGNETIIPAMFNFLHAAYNSMFYTPLGVTWSGARWQDLVLTLHWLLDFHPNGQEQFLWDMAELVEQQGFNWKDFYNGTDFPTQEAQTATLYTHGVNNGQALKSGAVRYRQTHNQTDWDSSYQRVQILDKYHGQASGIFSCDEHLAGLMPSRGTELCTVVEAMYSYEVLFGIHGDPMFAERAEQLGYNALPATITSDMWAHQYLQQDNEMNAQHLDDHIWTHDGPDATIFGLAPNYGCCTANFNQGWPKLIQNAVMISPDRKAIVIAILAPVVVTLDEISLGVSTNYPFDGGVLIGGRCKTSDDTMSIYIRIPSWAEGATLHWGTLPMPPTPLAPGKFYQANCLQITKGLTVNLPMKIRVSRRYNNAASIYHGPLLYGLEIQEQFKILRSYEFESKDYQITAGSPWNYAIHISDDNNADKDLKFQKNDLPQDISPFSIKGAPTKITATGRVLRSWGLTHNAPEAPPTSPVTVNGRDIPVTLLPFGATDLRIAEIPTYK